MIQLKRKKSRTKILSLFIVTVVILIISSLPYFHEFITSFKSGTSQWVPDFGLEKLLTDAKGKVLGFSTYRVFLYTLSIFVFSQIGWSLWLINSKRKEYFLAILIPVILGWYQLIIIVLNLRKSFANSLTIKLYILLVLVIITVILYVRKNSFKSAIVLKWLCLIGMATLPFLHDIITLRTGELRNWIPIFGIESILTESNGKVIGFSNYRVLIYTIMLHIYAHLGWLGTFIYYYYPPLRKVRTFLLIPVLLSLYSIIIIVLNWQESGFNKPDFKFQMTIVIALLLALNYLFNHKKDREAAL